MIFMATMILSSCINSQTRGEGSSSAYATRDVEVVFGDEQTYPRIALVIGNNNYQKHKKLINAVPDARAMRDFLTKRYFKVVYAENATQDVIKSKINEFLNGLGKKSIAVVYYAGHATQDKSRKTKETTNYILPINDTTLDKYITDYDNDAISFNNILNKIDEKNHGLNIAMLDACRTPIGRGGAIENIGAEGVYLVYSTASGTTASDSGAFRRSFLKYAEQPLKLTDIFGKVKLDLRNNGQRPSIQNDIVGTFYFTQAVKPTPTPRPTAKPQVIERIVYSSQSVIKPQIQNIENDNILKLEKCKKLVNKALDEEALSVCKKLNSLIGNGYVIKVLEGLGKQDEANEIYYKIGDNLKKQCIKNNQDACYILGGYFYDKNIEKSMSFLEKSCELKNIGACKILYSHYLNDKSTLYNQSKGVNILEKACGLNHAKACAILSHIYRHGEESIAKDLKKSIKFLKKACDLDDGLRCHILGNMYDGHITYYYDGDNETFYRESGIIENKMKAISFYEKACNLNNHNGCFYMGLRYTTGNVISKDLIKAKYFFKKSCNLGYDRSCRKLKTLF